MDNRVVWAEGIFLSPHHFQQQERYFENTLNQRVSVTSPFQWGFRRLLIEPDALLMGQISISEETNRIICKKTPDYFKRCN